MHLPQTNFQTVELFPAPLAPRPVVKTVLETVLKNNKQAPAYTQFSLSTGSQHAHTYNSYLVSVIR
jgi:hypothetical protein